MYKKRVKNCLYHNNSIFTDVNLLQTNGTAKRAPKPYSYVDLAVPSISNAALDHVSII